MSVTEPRFTRSEVEVLLASWRHDREPRGSHGFTIAEATDPANQYKFEAEDPIRDFAEQAKNAKRDAYRKRWGDKAEMDSLYFRVRKRG